MGASRRRGRWQDPFTRALTITVTALVVLIGVFVGLASVQGPKLTGAQIDLEQAVGGTGAQLRLFANQALSEVRPDQVAVIPDAAFTVSRAEDVLVIQFTAPLDHDTEYTVTAEGVTSLYRDSAATFEHTFSTGPAVVHYLDRADPSSPDTGDSVVRAGLSGGEQERVFTAPRIQEFTMVGDVIAATTVDDAGVFGLTLVNPADGVSNRLDLPPGVDSIAELASTADAGYLLFSAAPAGETVLYSIDTGGDRNARPVLGIDGAPVEILDWLVLPEGDAIVVQASDESLFRIDLGAEASVEPVGQYAGLESVSLDGSRLVVRDTFGLISLTLASREEERFTASPLLGTDAVVANATLVAADLTRVQKAAIFDEESGQFASYVVLDDGDAARVLLESPNQLGSLEDFSVSTNGQYVAVTVVPDVAAGISDQYAVRPTASSVTTVIVEIETGLVRASVPGFQLDWSR